MWMIRSIPILRMQVKAGIENAVMIMDPEYRSFSESVELVKYILLHITAIQANATDNSIINDSFRFCKVSGLQSIYLLDKHKPANSN